ncbi:MAG: 16S rRNA (guanine(527)-N(7))-methyltransferase RsmG [Clostridia bacterium]|nr:16S rRNA (guanine(527)-N(7))-methyltransferase RsmG [Clostridia bacterium]
MNTERLKKGLLNLQLPWDRQIALRFERFHDILDEYNRQMDLTAVLDEDERVDRHDLDSVAALALTGFPEGAEIIDVGTGAGFPGIPLLILRPDLQLTLLDAQQKRCAFLREALTRLELTARVVHARAEDAGQWPELREQFDVVVSRAVATMGVLQELMLPLARTGGKSIAWKGPKGLEELESARRAAFLLGGHLLDPVSVQIPGRPDWSHLLLITEKIRPTPAKYPRKAGLPGKKPLA